MTVLLKLPLASARERLDGQVRHGDQNRLQLGRDYWFWRRDWGLVLFVRPDWVNLYSPVEMLRLSPRGAGTAIEVTFIAPGFLLLLVWLVAAAGFIGKFRYWGAILEMAIAALGVHIVSYIFYRRELREIAEDLLGVVADAVIGETPQLGGSVI